MNILDQIYRERLETRWGRIDFAPGNWVFSPTPAQIERSGRIHQSEDASGRQIYLIKQRGVFCYNPEIGAEYPQLRGTSELWFVPAYICRKCQHYRKGKRRGTPRYPTCQWRASQNAETDAREDTAAILNEAIKTADRIMRK